jgi:hypothetical protein
VRPIRAGSHEANRKVGFAAIEIGRSNLPDKIQVDPLPSVGAAGEVRYKDWLANTGGADMRTVPCRLAADSR